ncbi:MAG TPA: glycosyltransferase family 4 protein [Pyrinomonadaceae bacterium]|nr:glycosyltransferase family 4 protein [Pyrinomonadaceae bacterium]
MIKNCASTGTSNAYDSWHLKVHGNEATTEVQLQDWHRNALELSPVVANWLIVGTGVGREEIFSRWPEAIRPFVEVVPRFVKGSEEEFLRRASVFVLPSFFEGQPLALLQAMEAGRCCITTNCCGQRDLIEHGFNGLLHMPGDAHQLASLIEKCLADKNLMTKLGRNGRKSVQSRSWENVSSEVVDSIERVM